MAHTRNIVGDQFMKSGCDYLLTVDSDMCVPFGSAAFHRAYLNWPDLPEPFASFHTIDRLLSHGKTLVGGLYFGRALSGTGKPLYLEGMRDPKEAEYARKAPYDLIKPTGGVATGCLLIHRSVFEDIEKKFPQLGRQPDGTGGNWFTSTEHALMSSVQNVLKELSSGPMSSEKCYKAYSMLSAAEAEARANCPLGIGEDILFCRRAAQAGHQCWVDMGLILGHIGSKVYHGRNTHAK